MNLTSHNLRMIAVAVTVLGLVAAAAGWFGLSYLGVVSRDTRAVVELSTTGDTLGPASDVKYHGLIVGRVTRVESGTGTKSADVLLYDEHLDRIPAGVTARVLPGTLFGGEYVDLVPPAEQGTGQLESGAVIPAAAGAGSVRIMDMFETTQRILTAIDPGRLDAAVSGLAQALDGNGADLGSFVRRADAFLGTLVAHQATFHEDLRLLGRILDSSAEAEPLLVAALQNSRVTARTLVEKRQAITVLVGAATSTVREGRVFLDATDARLVRLIDSMTGTLRTYGLRADRLGLVLDMLPHVVTNGAGGIGPNGIRINGYVATSPHHTYGAGDCPRYPGLSGTNCGGQP